ncbi:MAG TPA: YccF domain-containing protein [Chitinophagaceae bacterium]|nr:YccF domain-containing protein [Chitinophagaceae bacterium]
MNTIGNLIWLIFGGFLAALGYFFGGIVLCLTIVGIPWGLQCFKLADLALWPFGKKVISDSDNTGCLSTLCNIIWLICGGLYTALVHLVMGIILSITIIGIPWGRQHFKLIEVSLLPFGKRVIKNGD